MTLGTPVAAGTLTAGTHRRPGYHPYVWRHLVSWPPTRPGERERRNRRIAIIVVCALAATFVLPFVGIVLFA